MGKLYAVPIVYRGQDNFVVEADTPEQAKELASAKFSDGEPADEMGNEWEEIERVGEPEEVLPVSNVG